MEVKQVPGVMSSGKRCFSLPWDQCGLYPTCFQPVLETCLIGCPWQSLKWADHKPWDSHHQPPTSLPYLLPPPRAHWHPEYWTTCAGQRVHKLTNKSLLQHCKLRDEDTAAKWGWVLRLIERKAQVRGVTEPCSSENTEMIQLPQAGTAQLERTFQILTVYSHIPCYTCLYAGDFLNLLLTNGLR